MNSAPLPRPAMCKPVCLTDLAALIDAELIAEPGAEQINITGATLRAQSARPGDLFAGLAGSRVHGAEHVALAASHGAVAILTDSIGAALPAVRAAGLPVLVHPDPRAVIGTAAARIYDNPTDKLAVIGVTGTAGKTTVTTMIESGLQAAGYTTGLIGTVRTVIAGHELPSAFTTPEAPDLQALFAVMVERGVTHVAMEVSSHALALGRVTGTRFAVGAFTNLSQDHLDFHDGMEDYFAAKSKLFDGRAEREVVCIDNSWGQRLVKPETITVSLSEQSLWRAVDIQVGATGVQTFRALGPGAIDQRLAIRLPGSFNIANALLAAACLHEVGVSDQAIAAGLSTVDVPGRMERVNRGQDFTAVVDYAHKPAAVSAVLDSVRTQTSGRVIVVLGSGGDRDQAKRPMMGAAAASKAELTIITDDNPRSENPADIRAAMLAGIAELPESERGEVREIGDRAEAIRIAVQSAQPGDLIVIAGKGHETGQEIAGVVYPFDDRSVLADAIDARLAGATPAFSAEES